MSAETFHFPKQTGFYRGKVRDVYEIDHRYLVMIVSDRISAFDVILPRPIPYKGQVLNQIAAFMLRATSPIVPNWLIDTPLPHVSIGYKCDPFPVEMVVRGYLAGHAWRVYKSGKRELCGVKFPEGLRENAPLPEPVITPTTKAHSGHDEDVSREQILQQGWISEADYSQMETYALQLFREGQRLAHARGLILVDTKYEFGKKDNQIYLIDEVHTPDSSRYFYADTYEENFRNHLPQKQLSKEFVREWLMQNGFQGRPGDQIPEMTDEHVQHFSQRYIELYEQLTGQPFQPQSFSDREVYEAVTEALRKLGISA
ncbi:phosphoribosylaminoimidazole-succinocarboxamide synthase [Thermoflavifilum aggregans]|uniref:Phosphoribosylaminoimidazole-succinocarboxamide synthase n=1 Tax=Thermoflavifilum aggregans TaxID=454188 RepID=A0A2M9CTW4_9BACT|nr:phosphoribosylaminoimidazolesuccinocarboxamide synthase [Thermoflavifilum aggregans]PJJ75360.1 phosphoribosylaminoimidazole-succinocarboxamide synthase [Thermoflavifilum aggregans]